MHNTTISWGKSQSNIQNRRHKRRQRDLVSRNRQIITSHHITRYYLSWPEPYSWNSRIKWLQYHETSAVMTTTPLYFGKRVANRVWGHYWPLRMRAAQVHPHHQGQQLLSTCETTTIVTAKPEEWRPTRKTYIERARTDRGREIYRDIRREIQLPSWYHCTWWEITSESSIQWGAVPYTRVIFRIFLLVLECWEHPSISLLWNLKRILMRKQRRQKTFNWNVFKNLVWRKWKTKDTL